jgi:hypothetical protein
MPCHALFRSEDGGLKEENESTFSLFRMAFFDSFITRKRHISALLTTKMAMVN